MALSDLTLQRLLIRSGFRRELASEVVRRTGGPALPANAAGSLQNDGSGGLSWRLDAPAQEAVNTVAASGAAQTIPDPVTAQSISRITLTANCVLTFPTAGAGKSFTLMLIQDATGTRTVTWPAGTVQWSGGVAPVLSTAASKADLLTFVCVDGTNWIGSALTDVR